MFTILNSENMFLNSLAAWSAVLKGTQPKPEKSSSAFTTFWFAFAVAELAPISVNFLYRWAASTYSLCCEVSLRQLISFSPLCAILRSLPHAVHNAGTSHFREFWMRIFTPRIVEFYTIFLVLWRSWLWIIHHLFWILFHVIDYNW